jgi:1,2-diacylglycerol 3-alpha-glucosyltransferase
MLRAADLFVFASRTETQGLVLAEALAAGLPAVAVDGPGVRDSVRDGVDGIVVPGAPRSGIESALAQAIVTLADEAPRQAMAERASADAGRFSLDRRLDETVALYEGLRRA